MGDIIDTNLSKGKPIQVLPYINISNKYKDKCNFLKIENILQTLFEVSLYINHTSNITKLINYLQTMPDNLIFNIIEDYKKNTNIDELLLFLNQKESLKNIICSYNNITLLDPKFKNNFSYKISINFPIDQEQWKTSIQILQKLNLPFNYIFNITSLKDYQQAEELINEYQIEKFQLNPVYTKDNIIFFKENIYLNKEDILSTSISIKDFFIKQLMNTHDFGKINIMPNGDILANINHPVLGNIDTHGIFELIQKEIVEGKSWLRIRNQEPCNTCIYQWMCPSPSNYEIAIGRPNLCHVKH